MALYLSASTGETQQTVANSNDFTVHALRRDSEGMLYYTVARSTEDAVFDFHKTNGEQSPRRLGNFLQRLYLPERQ